MRSATLLLALPILAAAQTYVVYDCPGELYDNYCCVDGSWSGQVITSFFSVQSVVAASINSVQSISASQRAASIASVNSQRAASIASEHATRTFGHGNKRSEITPAPVKRAVVSEAIPGLTCVGAGVVTMNQPNANAEVAAITATAHSTYTGEVGIDIVGGHTLVGGNNAYGVGTLADRDSVTTTVPIPSAAAVSTTASNGAVTVSTGAATTTAPSAVSTNAAPLATAGPLLMVGGAAIAFAVAAL